MLFGNLPTVSNEQKNCKVFTLKRFTDVHSEDLNGHLEKLQSLKFNSILFL